MMRAIVLCAWAVLFGAACRVFDDRPEPTTDPNTHAISLSHAEVTGIIGIPKTHATDHEHIPLGPWRSSRSPKKGWKSASAPLPIRPRVFFFSRPVSGMQVIGPQGAIPHKRDAKNKDMYWTWSRKSITLHWRIALKPTPAPQEYRLHFDKALEREQQMFFHPDETGSERDFVQTKKQLGTTTYEGLYLPAPGHISFKFVVPPAAELTFQAGILPPEVQRDARTDGASLSLTITHSESKIPLSTQSLSIETLQPSRINLERWVGQTVTLEFRTESKKTSDADFCFIANPIVSSRLTTPKRIFWVFVDTLRPDHLGIYGYHRNTSPFIDDWAKSGTTFTQARSIAPWTLPSYRSMVTGRYPNRWSHSEPVQQTLSKKGWHTAMFAGNVYLSSNFEGDRGWGTHDALLDATATRQVDQITQWLAAHEDKNVFAMIHLMDPHLPYQEPTAYRRQFTTDNQSTTLPDRFARGTVLRSKKLDKKDRQYIRDRYDNNIRYVDDELKRLFSSFNEGDLVFFFSDHGEEFWEHGGFEHGHEFWDEIVRVPLIVSGPNVRVQRVEHAVTLLDLTPTVLEYIGEDPKDSHGQSLHALLSGEGDWTSNATGLGHPLYGGERWGVVNQGHKFSHYNGRERLFDLQADPKEQKNILPADLGPDHSWQKAVSHAFQQPFPESLRFTNRGSKNHPREDLQVELTVPSGIKHIWVGEDPLQASKAQFIPTESGALLTWPGGYKGSRDIYVVPQASIHDAVAQMSIQARIGHRAWTPLDLKQEQLDSRSHLLSKSLDGGGKIRATLGRAPAPTVETQEVVGHDDEMQEMLKALGYVTGNE